MQIRLISVISKLPPWVATGFDDYVKRLPKELHLECSNIPLCKRSNNQTTKQHLEVEGERILATIPKNSKVIALAVDGKPWSTEQLAEELKKWLLNAQPISLLVGGPDGLAKSCFDKAHQTWSLSPLTLPHALIRVIIAEQLYRAWSILQNHPYHR